MNQPFTWPALQQCLRERLTAEDFRAWIVPLQVVRAEQHCVVLEAPNDRFVAILEESLRCTLDAVVREEFGDDCRVDVSAAQLALGGVAFDDRALRPKTPAIRSGRAGADPRVPVSSNVHARVDKTTGSVDGRIEARRTRPPQAALVATSPSATDGTTGGPSERPEPAGRFDLGLDGRASTDNRNSYSGRRTAQPRSSADLDNVAVPERKNKPADTGPQPSFSRTTVPRFNPKYRFSNFVVGDSNQFASAAARAVAESPGQSYNPLFLYGGVGLGKTHLLHAIAQEILHGQPDLEVHYISAEQFLNELINSIRFDRMPLFRERYRSIDVLLIDDIQFLANKERTQEEFFHTFNALYTAEKQIILSSDASPKDIPTLEERLRSRFEWGLITDIQPPDLETKIAILRRKAALRRCELDDEVALFIASQVRSNVRELEGLLNRAIAFSSMTGRPLDLDLARETLKEILPQTDSRRNAAEIIRTVAKAYGLKVSEIKSRNKAHQISFPRQVAMYLCKQLTDLSFPEIGKQFGNKHHSTVMHSVDKITKLRVEDSELDRLIERLVLQLR